MRKLLLVVALLLAACGGDDGDAGETGGTATSASADATTTTTAAAEEPDGPVVTLRAGGLDVDGTELTFGDATQDDTVAALTAAFGDPVEERDLTECGEGPLHSVRFSSIAAYFADGVLGGWHLQRTAPVVLTTEEGIGLGSTRADLEAAFPELVVDETSLGIEFTAGTDPGPYLSGTLVDDSPEGVVDAMWSGMVCIAR